MPRRNRHKQLVQSSKRGRRLQSVPQPAKEAIRWNTQQRRKAA